MVKWLGNTALDLLTKLVNKSMSNKIIMLSMGGMFTVIGFDLNIN